MQTLKIAQGRTACKVRRKGLLVRQGICLIHLTQKKNARTPVDVLERLAVPHTDQDVAE